jgi:glycosyltransferase involved in cell wall biosynthesis
MAEKSKESGGDLTRVGLVACETFYPPQGGPSVHVFQVWHRLQKMGFSVHAWGRQAVPGCREYPRTASGFAEMLKEVDALYIRFPFESDFPAAGFPRLLLNRRPVVYEFDAPLYEWTRECPPRTLWSLRYKAILYGRNHLLVRGCADHGICVSREMEAYARREFGLRKLTVLPNGGDPERFHPGLRAEGRAAMGATEREFIVFWGGVTKYYWQGLSQLTAAAERCRGEAVRFVVAGDPAYLPQPVPPNILPIGQKTYFDIAKFMAGSDVCLAVYRDYDWCPIGFYGSAMKLFDYMSSGRPVIASRLGQICEVVQDGVNGYLTNGSPEELVEKIMTLRSDREKRERMGQAARETVLSKYNWQNVAERTAAILNDLVQKHGRRAPSARER